MSVCQEIRSYIKSSNKRIADVAAHLNMSDKGFRQSLDNESLSLKNYMSICDLYGLDYNHFLSEGYTFNENSDSEVNEALGKYSSISVDKTVIYLLSEIKKQFSHRIKNLEDSIKTKDELIEILRKM